MKTLFILISLLSSNFSFAAQTLYSPNHLGFWLKCSHSVEVFCFEKFYFETYDNFGNPIETKIVQQGWTIDERHYEHCRSVQAQAKAANKLVLINDDLSTGELCELPSTVQ